MGANGRQIRQQVHGNRETDADREESGEEVKSASQSWQEFTTSKQKMHAFHHFLHSVCSFFHAVPFLLCQYEERDPLPLLFLQECGTS